MDEFETVYKIPINLEQFHITEGPFPLPDHYNNGRRSENINPITNVHTIRTRNSVGGVNNGWSYPEAFTIVYTDGSNVNLGDGNTYYESCL